MEVGCVKENLGVAALMQGPVQEGLHLDVDVDADAAHLGYIYQAGMRIPRRIRASGIALRKLIRSRSFAGSAI